MAKELNDYMEKHMMDLEENPTKTIYMSVITVIIYKAIKYCIVGIILFGAGRYIGLW